MTEQIQTPQPEQITCAHRWHTNFTGTWRECLTCGRHERLS